MIDFEKKLKILQEASTVLENIDKKCDSFEQNLEVGKIKDLEVAKEVIKKLLKRLDK